MANYPLNKIAYDKRDYERTIDTSFNQLSSPPPPATSTITVAEFFNYYNTIFYDIPTEGDTNSHTFLVKKSGDYIGADNVNADVQLLLDEITNLRQQLLAANQTVLNLQISASQPQTPSSI
jgi:hypothetical protein